jgi:hypothetical protein
MKMKWEKRREDLLPMPLALFPINTENSIRMCIDVKRI